MNFGYFFICKEIIFKRFQMFFNKSRKAHFLSDTKMSTEIPTATTNPPSLVNNVDTIIERLLESIHLFLFKFVDQDQENKSNSVKMK